ncbi:nitrogenase component 1 [Butyrivibrio sp. AC2005]|uniref:nitrogenase component 1 n=1 Tax=Butyrivibrio sp. AC2005 TaxID=1280672 RepID=UPI000405E4CB|nr:nitrogenase component 1 [Butyrivibrio sp. AC2005]
MSVFIEQPRFSCALAAQQTVLAIPGAVPVIHAGPGCSAKAHRSIATEAGYQGEGFCGGNAVSSSNTGEKEVVFGGEGRLRETIDGALKVLDADLYVVLSGCTAGIVGDDSVHVAEEFRRKGYPVIGTETAGFKGNNYAGHEIIVKGIINKFLEEEIEPQVRKGLVNVFSVVPYQDPYWRGDLHEIKALLEKLGLEVNILFGYESKGVAEWKDIPNAEFNLIISPWVGKSVGELLQRKFGTPFLHYPVFPVGAIETSKFIREVGEFAKIPKEVYEGVIEKEEDVFYQYLISLADFIAEFRNSLPHEFFAVGDSLYTLGAARFLTEELGFIPKGIYAIDDVQNKKAKQLDELVASLGDEYKDVFVQESDGGLIVADIKDKLDKDKKTLLLGSIWERDIADEYKFPHVYLSYPVYAHVVVNKSYFGYKGGLNLLEDVYDSVFKKGIVTRTTISV